MANEREEARQIVQKIVEAERLGGGFRTYLENAVNIIERLLIENNQMRERLKAVDALQATTVQR